MAEMITLFVNGEEVMVESGKNLIDAVAAVGIEIPHLCYHPALGADGNCRLCLVEIEEGRPPVVPACKTPAQQGMRVRLDSEKIRKIQRDILELELINHPTDCPVCDQAGECALQDLYMKYDCQASRMRVPQVRKEKKLDFGCGVIHDQERCVLCARCVRFCRQITKTGELGIINRSDEARVTIFPGRPLNNRYALNVVDLCPVGAMTSADFRFQQRVWFLKKSPGVCHGCAKNCSITIDHNREKGRDDRIFRYRPRLNPQINGYFICDEGRLSYKQENENRMTGASFSGLPAACEEAVAAARDELDKARQLVVAISPDMSLEQVVAAKAFADIRGAKLFAPAEHFIRTGDGDGFLIQDDKAANRRGMQLLGVELASEPFIEALGEADLLLKIRPTEEPEDKNLSELLRQKRQLLLAAHYGEEADAAVALPLATSTECAGSVVNCDGILQTFVPAVRKNQPACDVIALLRMLGGPVQNLADARRLLQEERPFAGIDFTVIPEQGLQLP